MTNWHNKGTYAELVKRARSAAVFSYAPYTKFSVGAAVLMLDDADRHFFSSGAVIECATPALGLCAERVAVSVGLSMGCTRIVALAITSPDLDEEDDASLKMPCGSCRQFLSEFCDSTSLVLVDGVGQFRLDELLPRARRLRQP